MNSYEARYDRIGQLCPKCHSPHCSYHLWKTGRLKHLTAIGKRVCRYLTLKRTKRALTDQS